MEKLLPMLSAVSVAFVLGSAAHAQSMAADIGRFEYENSCVACHGADGKGNGSIAGYLNTTPTDLTMLQKDNGGVFPVSSVFETIEAGPDAGPHGTRDMPAWGQRYIMRAEGNVEYPVESQLYAQTRILALIEYLTTIQEN